MDRKNKMTKRALFVLSLLLLISGIIFTPVTVHAAGWLDYAQELTLGTTVSGSIKTGDYRGLPEVRAGSYYWHIYKISMPKDGILNMYIESASSEYLSYGYMNYTTKYHGFAIFSASNPDDLIWRSCGGGENKIDRNYSSSRAMYYGSTEIALEQGDYYFVIRRESTVDTPYYLTLSYKESIINVTSITLNPYRMTLETGNQRNITATVLPDNATDKTVLWRSSNPSVATVDNGTVTAVSSGEVLITAASADGEITNTCVVTVNCSHNYQTSMSPATTESDGSIAEVCTKCGDRKEQTIYKISSINLSKASYTYDGQTKNPTVFIADSQGNTLENGKDYEVLYPDSPNQIGIYNVNIEFTGNYYGTVEKQFKIFPKPTRFIKVTPKKNGIALKWERSSADCGYEIAYSTSKAFTKENTHIVDIKTGNTVSKSISRLRPKQRYYVRIRTYKNVSVNGKTTKLYSSWSKEKSVSTKNS